MKEKGKERFAVKRRKNNNIKILRQEAPIPEIVEQKIGNAFLAIKNGEVSCGSESMTAHSCKKPVRKWSFASVAAFVVCAATACAASYSVVTGTVCQRLAEYLQPPDKCRRG